MKNSQFKIWHNKIKRNRKTMDSFNKKGIRNKEYFDLLF